MAGPREGRKVVRKKGRLVASDKDKGASKGIGTSRGGRNERHKRRGVEERELKSHQG